VKRHLKILFYGPAWLAMVSFSEMDFALLDSLESDGAPWAEQNFPT